MSVRIMSRVWEHSTHTGNALLLLLAIADFADDAGRAYPSVAALARKVRVSERTVQRLLHELEASGELKITRRGVGRSHPHQFAVALRAIDRKGDNLSPFRAGKGDIALSPFRGRKGDKSGSEKVTNLVRKGDTAVSPEPPIEPPNRTTTTNGDGATTATAGGGGGGEIERVMRLLEAQNVKRNRRTLALAKRLATIGEAAAQKLIEREAADLRRDKTARSFAAVLVARLEQADLEAERARLTETIRPVFQEVCLNGHAH